MGNSALERTAHSVVQSVKNGKIRVGSKELNISEELAKTASTVYRTAGDIDKAYKDAEKSRREENSEHICIYKIKSYGTGDAAFDTTLKGKKALLNFASSKHPGGGFIVGSMAQEESLCHQGNLYCELLKYEDSFYSYNREHTENGLYQDGIIYSTDVVFFKRSNMETKPVLCDVITCAAPNRDDALRKKVSEKEIDSTMSRRIEQVLKVAVANGVNSLVLGAFGCGVFKNDVNYVASEMSRLLKNEGYGKYFDTVVFALAEARGKNTDAFKNNFAV